MARSGMVNIDDITDTKHLPAVEVKPFTNDHRPLADLVREAPPKVQAFLTLCSSPTDGRFCCLLAWEPGRVRQKSRNSLHCISFVLQQRRMTQGSLPRSKAKVGEA